MIDKTRLVREHTRVKRQALVEFEEVVASTADVYETWKKNLVVNQDRGEEEEDVLATGDSGLAYDFSDVFCKI